MLRMRVDVVEGRPVVVKEADPGPAAERLRREATALRRAAHPGVVELLGVADHPAGTALTLAYVAARPAHDTEVRGDVGLVASLTADVAATLADLHQRGVVHGRLTPDHVLVTAEGRTVLAGLADARLADDADPTDGAADVTALGALVLALVGEDDGEDATALRALAARAAAGELGAVGVAAAARRLAAPLVVLPRRRPRRAPRRLLGTAVAVAGLALASVPASAVLTGAGSADADAVTSPSPRPPSGPSSTTTPSAPASPPPSPWADGVIDRDGHRWRIGAPGDVAVLGDWDCDGELTPALLRPSTGEVWRWSAWPDEAGPRAGEVVGRVEGAADLRVADVDGDACEDLVPVGGDGSVLALPG